MLQVIEQEQRRPFIF